MIQELQKLRSYLQSSLALVDAQIAARAKRGESNAGKIPPRPKSIWNIRHDIIKHWQDLPETFTASKVKELIRATKQHRWHRTDSAFSAALSQYAIEGYLTIKEEGSGRRATVYQKAKLA